MRHEICLGDSAHLRSSKTCFYRQKAGHEKIRWSKTVNRTLSEYRSAPHLSIRCRAPTCIELQASQSSPDGWLFHLELTSLTSIFTAWQRTPFSAGGDGAASSGQVAGPAVAPHRSSIAKGIPRTPRFLFGHLEQSPRTIIIYSSSDLPIPLDGRYQLEARFSRLEEPGIFGVGFMSTR